MVYKNLLVGPEMRAHRLIVEGDFYTQIRTLYMTGYRDLGIIAEQASTGTSENHYGWNNPWNRNPTFGIRVHLVR